MYTRSYGTEKHCRKLFRRALERVWEWVEVIGSAYQRFEEETGTLESMEEFSERYKDRYVMQCLAVQWCEFYIILWHLNLSDITQVLEKKIDHGSKVDWNCLTCEENFLWDSACLGLLKENL